MRWLVDWQPTRYGNGIQYRIDKYGRNESIIHQKMFNVSWLRLASIPANNGFNEDMSSKMTIFDILAHDTHVIVFSNVEMGSIYVWNRKNQLHVFVKNTTGMYYLDRPMDHWNEIDMQTLGDVPSTYEAARIAAIKWAIQQ